MPKYAQMEMNLTPLMEGSVPSPTPVEPSEVLLVCKACAAQAVVCRGRDSRPGSLGYLTLCGKCGTRGYFPVVQMRTWREDGV